MTIEARTYSEPPVLGLGTLARFATPLTWAQIRALIPQQRRLYSADWWRQAVMQAEDDGHLRWTGEGWTLTDAGRALVRGVA